MIDTNRRTLLGAGALLPLAATASAAHARPSRAQDRAGQQRDDRGGPQSLCRLRHQAGRRPRRHGLRRMAGGRTDQGRLCGRAADLLGAVLRGDQGRTLHRRPGRPGLSAAHRRTTGPEGVSGPLVRVDGRGRFAGSLQARSPWSTCRSAAGRPCWRPACAADRGGVQGRREGRRGHHQRPDRQGHRPERRRPPADVRRPGGAAGAGQGQRLPGRGLHRRDREADDRG
jgi:hypothetical protein